MGNQTLKKAEVISLLLKRIHQQTGHSLGSNHEAETQKSSGLSSLLLSVFIPEDIQSQPSSKAELTPQARKAHRF